MCTFYNLTKYCRFKFIIVFNLVTEVVKKSGRKVETLWKDVQSDDVAGFGRPLLLRIIFFMGQNDSLTRCVTCGTVLLDKNISFTSTFASCDFDSRTRILMILFDDLHQRFNRLNLYDYLTNRNICVCEWNGSYRILLRGSILFLQETFLSRKVFSPWNSFSKPQNVFSFGLYIHVYIIKYNFTLYLKPRQSKCISGF